MIRSTAKALLRRVAETPAFRTLEGCWYRSVRIDAGVERNGVLLITTPGGGNIGDQAMFESFLRNSSGLVRAVVSRPGALVVPEDLPCRVEVHVLHGLFLGRPQLSASCIRQFGRLLNLSDALVVVGADIVDGSYSFRQAWSIAEALRLAVRLGRPARVIGFSWGKSAHPVIQRAYRNLGGHVNLLVRDKHSLDRLIAAGIAARLVPDTVFALESRHVKVGVSGATREPFQAVSKPIALLNISGLLRNRHELVDQYRLVIRELGHLGYKIVLLPHVFRPGDDDLAASKEVVGAMPEFDLELVGQPLSPSDIQAMATAATLVITGRMHLAILALTVCTPTIVFGSQGKVEGMLALFDLEDFAVQPGPDLAAETIARLHRLHVENNEIRTLIAQRLPHVVEASRENFVS